MGQLSRDSPLARHELQGSQLGGCVWSDVLLGALKGRRPHGRGRLGEAQSLDGGNLDSENLVPFI